MRDVFAQNEVPAHLREFFTPVGGGDGVASASVQNSHPT